MAIYSCLLETQRAMMLREMSRCQCSGRYLTNDAHEKRSPRFSDIWYTCLRIMRVSKFPSFQALRGRFDGKQRSVMVVLLQHWSLWVQNGLFAVILLILLQSTNSKREKVWFRPLKVDKGHHFLARSPNQMG